MEQGIKSIHPPGFVPIQLLVTAEKLAFKTFNFKKIQEAQL